MTEKELKKEVEVFASQLMFRLNDFLMTTIKFQEGQVNITISFKETSLEKEK